MDYRKLGNTDLNVSCLCLGTMTMGWTSSKADSFAVMDRALVSGINFFDSADVYSYWAKDNPGGVAESWIGEWLTARKAQGQVIIATKARGRMWEGQDGEGLSRSHLLRAVEDSLRRLQVERIDLYQSHWPDENTPLEETLRAFEEIIKQGKVRYIGCSNHTAPQLEETLRLSTELNLPRYESLQPHYNLVHRQEYEAELMALCRRENLGVIPYSPLAGGFLTGKYKRDGHIPAQSRGAGNERMRNYTNNEGFSLVETLAEIGSQYGATTAQMGLAWLLANPTVTSAIIGANTAEQLDELIPAVNIALSPAEKNRLDEMKSPT